MDEKTKSFCFVCKESDVTLKSFLDSTWRTALNAAKLRSQFQSDTLSHATTEILTKENCDGLFYHSKCLSRFSAVKRRFSSDGGSSAEDYSSKPSKLTRAASHQPTTNQKGVWGSQCIFCAKTRKRKKYNSSETLHQCMTIECSKEIIASAQRAGDSKILAIGEDLIAKEARYHHSCRRNYLRDHRKQGIEPDNQMSKKIVMILHFQSCLLSLKK